MKKFLAILLSMSTLIGCNVQSNEESLKQEINNQVDNDVNQMDKIHKMGDIAQISAIDGNSLTLKLASKPEFTNEPISEPESGMDKAEKPEMIFDSEEITVENANDILKTISKPDFPQDKNKPEKPADGEKPFDGQRPPNGEPNPAENQNYEELDISELSVGDIVNVVYNDDNETIKYIVYNKIDK